MATVDLYVWKRPAKDGKFPISVRITINRKPSYIMTGQKLDNLNQWDSKMQRVRKSHPNSVRLNNFLLSEIAKANDKALELETKGLASSKKVKVGLKPIEVLPVYFKDVARQYLKDQEALGNYESYATEDGRFKRLYDFAKNDNLTFNEITVEFLQRYRIYLKQCKKPRYNENTPEKPISDRTVTNYLISVRTIFNRAISAKLISKDIYPFGGKGNISIRLSGSSKIGLEEAEIKKLEQLDLSEYSEIYHHARNIWLLEFYFAGMRVTDCLLLKWNDFQNGRLYYQMSKNGEHGSVKVPDKAIAILDRYRDSQNAATNIHGLIFPFLKDIRSLDERLEVRRKIAFAVKRLNKAMSKIMTMIGSTKNASQHKARHSFAQRAEEKEIHPKVLQKMYRHESILTTMIYQSNFSFKKADDAIDAVLNF
ncbi:MAG TPA: site-specific integrase [Mucilaginibacter sp.]|jgi:integrase|nr:site-specific integrase [Mucilaginibacter sp.]